jgi:hypothetical protein
LPDRPVYAVIVQPTIAQESADWHLARFGRPAPGMPAALLGYLWTCRDVAYGRDRARGQAPTAALAKAAGLAAARGEPEPREQELLDDSDQPEDPALELVRRGVGVYDQDTDAEGLA